MTLLSYTKFLTTRFPMIQKSLHLRNLSTSRVCPKQIFLKNKVGCVIEGYKLEKITPVKELNLTVGEFLHEKSGAKHLHIAADDANNAFSVSFKTPVSDDTGVAHILEHMVLCGSQKYPIHDPFFKMTLRSVSTFMNAMTFPDHTSFPFSSVNKQDFKNLMSIYLDCVFNPLLRKKDFKQEAWRLESEDNSPPHIKGVVFNEMKGAMNSQGSIQDLEFFKRLLPQSYPNNSGGNPLNIVDLTYEQLLNFHHQFYTPKNSLFITYGDTAVEEHLKISNEILNNTNHAKLQENRVILPSEPSWSENRREKSTVPFDPLLPEDKQSIFTIGYKLDTNVYNEDIFTLSVMSKLLLEGPNAPFHKSLLTKKLGSDYCGMTGLNTYTKSPTFGIGLKGVNDRNISQIEEIITSTLKQVQKSGFETNHFLGVIKETELALKHILANTGVGYVTALPTRWAHGYDPVETLKVKKYLDHISEQFEHGFFQEAVTKHLIENKHQLILHLQPDKEFLNKINKEETLLVHKLVDSNKVSIENAEKVVEDEDYVDKILPKISLQDLSDKIPIYQAEHNVIGDETPLQTSSQPTNGLSYVRMNINANSVPLLLRPYLPLFSHIITQFYISYGFQN